MYIWRGCIWGTAELLRQFGVGGGGGNGDRSKGSNKTFEFLNCESENC